jgi:hypothetical protein
MAKIDCNLDSNIFKEECKDDNKKIAFCNQNKTNAYSDNCVKFCTPSICHLKKRYDFCKEHNIDDLDCDSEQKVLDLQNKCMRYTFLKPDSSRNYFTDKICNKKEIDDFEKDCIKYNIPLNSCTLDTLENAQFREGISIGQSSNRRQEMLSYAQSQKETNIEKYRQTKDFLIFNLDLTFEEIIKKLGGEFGLLISGSSSVLLTIILILFLKKAKL